MSLCFDSYVACLNTKTLHDVETCLRRTIIAKACPSKPPHVAIMHFHDTRPNTLQIPQQHQYQKVQRRSKGLIPKVRETRNPRLLTKLVDWPFYVIRGQGLRWCHLVSVLTQMLSPSAMLRWSRMLFLLLLQSSASRKPSLTLLISMVSLVADACHQS